MQVAPGELRTVLPAMPPGRYRLFADIVHQERISRDADGDARRAQRAFAGVALDAEDASAATPPPISPRASLARPTGCPTATAWSGTGRHPSVANQPVLFRFQLRDAQGRPAADVAPYLGMAGHAAFVKTDWTTFAHTHPEGSAPMQAMMVANGDCTHGGAEHVRTCAADSRPRSSFPTAFRPPGRYRIFVQMKHGNVVETGTFDADVR